MDPNKLTQLPLASVLAIPVEHWMALDPAKLSPFDVDVVKAIDGEVLAQAQEAGVSFGTPYEKGSSLTRRRLAFIQRNRQRNRWN